MAIAISRTSSQSISCLPKGSLAHLHLNAFDHEYLKDAAQHFATAVNVGNQGNDAHVLLDGQLGHFFKLLQNGVLLGVDVVLFVQGEGYGHLRASEHVHREFVSLESVENVGQEAVGPQHPS